MEHCISRRSIDDHQGTKVDKLMVRSIHGDLDCARFRKRGRLTMALIRHKPSPRPGISNQLDHLLALARIGLMTRVTSRKIAPVSSLQCVFVAL